MFAMNTKAVRFVNRSLSDPQTIRNLLFYLAFCCADGIDMKSDWNAALKRAEKAAGDAEKLLKRLKK